MCHCYSYVPGESVIDIVAALGTEGAAGYIRLDLLRIQVISCLIVFSFHIDMSSAIIPTLNAHLVVDVVVYYLVFRLFKWLSSPYLFPHFRHIPGPPSESWFKGTRSLKSYYPNLKSLNYINWKGNLGQLFNAKGLPFHQQLVDRFGGMVKVYGFFGVSVSFLEFFSPSTSRLSHTKLT